MSLLRPLFGPVRSIFTSLVSPGAVFTAHAIDKIEPPLPIETKQELFRLTSKGSADPAVAPLVFCVREAGRREGRGEKSSVECQAILEDFARTVARYRPS